MFKKIAIGLLVLTVLGAGGAAMVYNVTTVEPTSAGTNVLAQGQAQSNDGNGYGQQGTQGQGQSAQQGVPEMVAEGSLGDPWMKTGVVTSIEDNGIQMTLENGESVFVELGPVDYWTSQGIAVNVGDTVTIDGSINEGMIHATALIAADGQVLQLRSDAGQPLWSGGANNGQGQNGNGEANGAGQVAVDEWFTLEGTLMSFQGGNMTMSTADGEIVSFRTGQPRFFSEQGVSFQVGDEIIVVGYYDASGQFAAGDITQVSTGARVMLLDPNGRPLWAGPGNGNGKGNGNH